MTAASHTVFVCCADPGARTVCIESCRKQNDMSMYKYLCRYDVISCLCIYIYVYVQLYTYIVS